MTLHEVKNILDCIIINGEKHLDIEVEMACGSDLMSDVLAFTKSGALLLTGLINVQSVRAAIVADIKAVVYVRGKVPDKKIINIAKENDIPLLSTNLYMFEACGKLYKHGLIGISEYLKIKNEYSAR
ncbi:hypothetical protein KAS50_04630 [bacterium]|nr:hypothetical protein [bacterium]